MFRDLSCKHLIWAAAMALAFCVTGVAQSKTIIIVRHAEKADSSPDTELSETGSERAERLAKVLKRYRPGAFYSTDLKRTRNTIAPLARKRGKTIEVYNARRPEDLLDTILKSRTKRFVVAGHSNTVPGLANLLGGKDIFKDLDEDEFGVIWIIRLKNGRAYRTEIVPY